MTARNAIARGIMVVTVTALLGGCGGGADLGQLDARLEEIKARPRGRIEPPPEFKPIATYSYAAHKLRPPFSPPQDQKLLEVPEGRSVEPDLSRPKEYLEGFSIDSLNMVGTITRPGNPLEALIADPTGAVTRVRVGSHMGKNYGRVVDVGAGQLGLVEIVPDGQGGWVERSRNITLAD
ncbi:pilus assembly protein PilP [Alloalcanivorax gelatiniphagus]|nr:pilus assembly protein PilP [Alloalcanivorax gelatiniphagus]|tara:strand:- start:6368 stop:6904 length:537 start_codon:yes stop_codon:yes gene_type:complete